jgi:hypothetical protein
MPLSYDEGAIARPRTLSLCSGSGVAFSSGIPSHFRTRFCEACIWRFCGAKLRIMQLIRKSDSRIKHNLRLAQEKLKAVDALRQSRGTHCWRNTWMAEAITNKIARESQSQRGTSGASDA